MCLLAIDKIIDDSRGIFCLQEHNNRRFKSRAESVVCFFCWFKITLAGQL